MTTGSPEGLQLTEEEAFALLAMCLTSPHSIDAASEKALRKLAEYAIKQNLSKGERAVLLEQFTVSSA